MRLADKVIIVTGGANGLGSLYCERFVAEGARIAIADVDVEAGEKLADRLNASLDAPRALFFPVDVTSEGETRQLAEATIAAFGRIDVLVNNAGSYPHQDFDQITLADWNKVIAVNLTSVYLCASAVLPYMRRVGRGKIINVATNLVWIGLPSMVHYVTAKAGILGFTRSLAREMGPHGIIVNAVAPGAIMPDVDGLNERSRERVASIVGYQALRRSEEPGDLVGPMIFLASDDSDFITGQVLTVDGGLTNH
jgi:NAD(P)-dependent dehydrogenase (short-subunit alcohol dehydrogenase family)